MVSSYLLEKSAVYALSRTVRRCSRALSTAVFSSSTAVQSSGFGNVTYVEYEHQGSEAISEVPAPENARSEVSIVRSLAIAIRISGTPCCS